MRKLILQIIQVFISLLLIGAILIQAKGVGLSSTFGGEGGFYRSKRGIERAVFVATIVLAGLFLVVSLAGLIVS